jgi:hypothetical protein
MTDEKLIKTTEVVEPVEKVKVQVRDGVAFIYQATIKTATGFFQNFIPQEPALSGEVIEIDPVQAFGQEQKLMRMEPVTLSCNNSSCKNIFETDAYDIRVAYCDKCGARGGTIVETKTKTKTKTDKTKAKPKIEETDRMDRKEEETRDAIVPDFPKPKTVKKTDKDAKK